jgi:TonB family protein
VSARGIAIMAVLAFILAIVCATRTSWAAPTDLVPPRAIETPRVPYPDGASGDASVVLDLVIDATGKVTKATAVEGDEPFASAAQAAALAWKFEPAHRGDRNVAARIRMLVDFHPPQTAPPPEETPPPVADAGADAAPTKHDQVEEVTVTGERKEVGRTELGGGDVREMPGAFGDAFRAIDAMPGVVPMVSGLPYYFIRGAPPGNTGYMIDGIRVPLLFHFGVARAVVHPALIDHVDFYPGGFPAKYGRFVGGIIDGRTKPPIDRFHGEWDVSLLHAGAYVETPFGKEDRGTFGIAGRYGYPGLLLSVLAPEVFLQYGDYQTRTSWRIDDRNTVSVFAFGSVDAGGNTKNGKIEDLTSTQFHRIDTRWDHDLGKLGHVRTALTLGMDQTSSENSFGIRDLLFGVRTEWEVQVSDNVRVRAGSDAWFDHFTLLHADSNDETAQQFATRDEVTGGVWADTILRVSPDVEIVPGMRFDFFESNNPKDPHDESEPAVDPRIATRVKLSKKVTWITANGVMHQTPSFIVPVPGLKLGGLGAGLQTAVQTSQGFEFLVPLDFTLATTVFLNNVVNMTDATASCGFSQSGDIGKDCIDERTRGRTYGFELLLRRPLTKKVTGWISYTLSRSTRVVRPFRAGPIAQEAAEIPSEFDRTHVLNVIGAVDLGRNWRLGGRTLYYTGRPYSNTYLNVPVPPYNSERLPPFFRIDVRLEKRWMTKSGYVAFVAEGLNVTANKETIDVKCTQAPPGTPAQKNGLPPLDKCEPDTAGSIPVIVPLIGVEGAF